MVCPVHIGCVYSYTLYFHITLSHRDGIEHQMHFIAARDTVPIIITIIINRLIFFFDIEYFWLNNAFIFQIMFYFEIVGSFFSSFKQVPIDFSLAFIFIFLPSFNFNCFFCVFHSLFLGPHTHANAQSYTRSYPISHIFFMLVKNFSSGWMHNNDDKNWYK